MQIFYTKMKYLTIIFIFSTFLSLGQESKTPVLEQYPGQLSNNPIKYTFPDTVNSLISEYMHSDIGKFYFLELVDHNKHLEIRVFPIEKFEITDTLYNLYLHIFSANRYCLVNNIAVPVLLKTDKENSSVYWMIEGVILVIYLRRDSVGNYAYETKKMQFNVMWD